MHTDISTVISTAQSTLNTLIAAMTSIAGSKTLMRQTTETVNTHNSSNDAHSTLLANYATKAELGEITNWTVRVVNTLPNVADGETGVFYWLANSGESGNNFDEYIFHDGAFEKLGPKTVDLSNYSTLANTVKAISINGTSMTVTFGNNTSDSETLQDANVAQKVSSANENHPILLAKTKDATTDQAASEVLFSQKVKINPSTGILTASGFSGDLTGNVTGNLTGNVTGNVSGSAGSVEWSNINSKPGNFTPSSHTHGNLTNDGKMTTANRVPITNGSKELTLSDVTDTELGYLSGVTSAIQTQLNGKAASSHGTHVTYSTTAPAANGTAAAGQASTVARSDHVHPAQTSVSGNAGTATKLAATKTINGVSFDGSADISHSGECSTAAATAAKTVTLNNFTLTTGAVITVKFTVTNTASNPTLSINNSAAKPIYYHGEAIPASYLTAGRTYSFRYNGSQWDLIGDIKITSQPFFIYPRPGEFIKITTETWWMFWSEYEEETFS